jgi:hypothetical protein
VVTLSTNPLSDATAVDLYVALRLPNGNVLFTTGDPFNPFSGAPNPYRRALSVTRTSYEVLNIVLPESVPAGTYGFLAAFIRLGRPPTITEIIGQLATLDVVVAAGGVRPARTPIPPPSSGGGVGSIGGLVRDSQTGRPLVAASILVSGGGGSAITISDGSFTINNVPVGPATVTASLAGYITASRTVTVEANQTASANLALSPQASLGTGQVRIVLSWGQSPSDLDSHLTGLAGSGSGRFHVFYQSRGSVTGEPLANLDRDDTDSIGPETITIAQVRSGVYRYSIHDYSNRNSSSSSALSQSAAHVAVFFGDRQAAEFDVPRNTPGTVWSVFEIEGGQIRPINTLSFVSSPSDITRFSLAPGENPALFWDLPAK